MIARFYPRALKSPSECGYRGSLSMRTSEPLLRLLGQFSPRPKINAPLISVVIQECVLQIVRPTSLPIRFYRTHVHGGCL